MCQQGAENSSGVHARVLHVWLLQLLQPSFGGGDKCERASALVKEGCRCASETAAARV